MNTEKSRDEMLRKHFDRWQQLGRLAGTTNEAMAENALLGLYRLTKQAAPRQIAWLDSPLQMAAIPVLVANIVESETWKSVYRRMSTERVGTEDWDRSWKRQWQILENGEVHDLLGKVVRRPDFLNVHEDLVRGTVASLHNTLRKGLCVGGLQPGSMKFKRHVLLKPHEGVPNWVPGDPIPIKHLAQTQKEIYARAGVKQPSQVMENFEELLKDVSWIKTVSTLVSQTQQNRNPDKQAVLNLILDRSRRTFDQLQRQRTYLMSMPTRVPDPPPPPPEANGIDADGLKLAATAAAFVWSTTKDRADLMMSRAQVPFVLWLPANASHIPFAMACQAVYPDFFGDLAEHIDTWALLSHAAAGYFFANDIVYVCRRPMTYNVDGSNRVHSEDGPAIVWRDGYEVYAWKGINVDKNMIMNRQSITVQSITDEPNAEIRRTMIEIYGEAKYLMNAGANLVHTDEFGRLYELKRPNGDHMQMVRVTNSTPEPDGTFKDYFLSVPPFMKTAKQAVAWTFNMQENEYCPTVQT